MGSRAQVSVEFFILVGMGFLIAIGFEIAALDQLKDFRVQRESDAVKDLALKLQKEALIAASVEDGYVRDFTIPIQLDNSVNYTFTIPNSVGNLSKGSNRINKTGGVIYIN